ncbi:low temperature requirement protein A [Micromonospora sp. 067-2]|uniref:low temperature requirement protein A n=1 Tax=Micromonospora sp. 067-2 TaxID=2789270 RepID=UPI00397A38AC
MTTAGAAELVRRPEGSTRATLLELLFDVVFVAALALTSMLLARRDTWTGAGQVLLMLAAIWWTWSITTTTTDFYDPDRRPIQAILMVTMLGAVGMAAALPLASNEHALVFAVAYVTPHLVRGIVLISVLHRHRHRAQERAARFLFWFLVSGVFWITGALLGGSLHWAFWIIAVVVDYVSSAARYPTPWLGRVPVEQYEKTAEHLAERYQQFLILALGDIILVPTLEISTADFTRARLGAFLTAFVTMLLLWQMYVFRAGAFRRPTSARELGVAARLGPYTHVVMVTGVVATAAGVDLVIAHPTGETSPRWVALIFGGPAVFLIGRGLFTYLIAGRLPLHRVGWLVLLPLGFWAVTWPPVLVSTVAVLVLAAIAAADALPREPTARPRR